MTSSTSSSEIGAAGWAAAVLGPALVLGAWVGWFSQAPPVTPDAKVVRMEEELDAADPVVLVLGNSASFAAIDADALGRALGVPGRVYKAYVPSSRSPAWYAMLRNRVLARGLEPELVLVVAPSLHMVDMTMDEARRDRLRPQLGPDDDALRSRVLDEDTTWPVLQRARHAAGEALETPKRVAVAALFADHPELDWWEAARRTADEAGEEVFDLASGMQADLHSRILPIAAVERTAPEQAEAARDPSATFVPELVDLAHDHDLDIAFVGMPLPATAAGLVLDDPTQRQLVEVLAAHGAAWIDLSGAPIPASGWGDDVHMNPAGRAVFTEALGQALVDLGALGDAPLPVASLPLAVSGVHRTGTPPSLPSLPPWRTNPASCRLVAEVPAVEALGPGAVSARLGVDDASPVRLLHDGVPLAPGAGAAFRACEGAWTTWGTRVVAAAPQGSEAGTWALGWSEAVPDTATLGGRTVEAWWVLPGTSLTWSLPEPWTDDRGPLQVDVDVLRTDPTTTVSLEAAGVAATASGADRLVSASVAPPAGAGPWSITVRAEGGAALVRRLRVGTGWQRVALVDVTAGASDALRLLGSPRGQRTVTASGPPPALDQGDVVADDLGKGRRGGRLAAPGLQPLALERLKPRVAGHPCPPLVVTEDGVPLPRGNLSLGVLLATDGGGFAVGPEAVLITAADGSTPGDNGRRYRVALDDQRLCHGKLWVYPGDALDVAFPLPSARVVPGGALAITGVAVPEAADGALRVQAWVEDVAVLDTSVPLAALGPEATVLPLTAPVGVDAAALRVRLSGADPGAYALVTGLVLQPADVADPSAAPEPAADTDAPAE